jgi:kynurenine formamidase
MRIVELSHPVSPDMPTYQGMPAPELTTYISREQSAARLGTGVSFHIGHLGLPANTGTYVDAPFHYHPELADIGELPAERLVDVPIVVVAAVGLTAVDVPSFGDPTRLAGTAVLVHTGWSRHWGTAGYATGSPYLTAGAVKLLVDAGIAVVGIDALNVDDTADLTRPAHSGLLGAGIPILEHLTGLDALPATGARLTALPPPVRGIGSFPVRAVAVLPPVVTLDR